jgi:gliding motility-associated-like protein
VLRSVSVSPETGKTDFTWSPSPTPGIESYILYTYNNGDGIAIDTIHDPSATSRTITTNASKYLSVAYVLTAHLPGLQGCTSPLSNAISTIFCNAVLDTCSAGITISWNKYSDFPKKVTGYRILVSENGGIAAEKYSADNNSQSFVITDFKTDANYCFSVRAMLDDGTYSGSNKTCLSTRMQRPPAWINADYASINSQNKPELSFTIDPASGIKRFILERSNEKNSGFSEISSQTSVNGKVTHTDNQADTKKIYYYRLSAVNSCNNVISTSGVVSNIVLSAKLQDEMIMLSWNSSLRLQGSSASYMIFADIGNGYENKAVIQDTTLIFPLRDLMFDIKGKELCFYAEARETGNPNGINSISRSSTACTASEEVITVPNLFTPNNDSRNDRFKPVLSFTPSNYRFTVSDRKGRVLFDTTDYLDEWDGNNSDGQDVFLWFVKIITPSGKNITRTGTVTILK